MKRIIEYLKNNKFIYIVIGMLIIMLFFTCIGFILNEKRIENKINSINLNFSSDYTYFDNTMEDFSFVLVNDLKNNDIKVVSSSMYQGSDWADKYRYDIKLDNGDYIYLSSNFNNEIERIIYKGNIEDTKYLGKFVGTIPRLYIKNLDGQSLETLQNNTFLLSENLSKNFGDSYVYSHLKFEWFRSYSDKYFMVTFKVVPEENQEQYLAKIEEEKRIKEEKERLEEEQKKQKELKEQEKKAQEEKERKEKLAQNERIFTAGAYTVGKDIEAGTYNMIALSGRGICFVRGKMYVGETFTPNGDEYAIDNYKNVVLSNGGTIEVTSTLKIKFEPVI